MFGLLRHSSAPPALPDWQKTRLFDGFDADALDWLEQHVQPHELRAGETLITEGDNATHLYVLTSGRLEVYKREKHSIRTHRIALLDPGDVVGEIALLDKLPRAASVRAIRDCKLYAVLLDDVRKESLRDNRLAQRVYLGLMSNLATLVARKLRVGSEDALTSAHERAAMGELIVNMLILLCGYVLLIAALPTLELLPANTMFVSIPIMLIFGLGSWRFIRSSGYPMSTFGLSSQHFFGSLLESGIFTVPFLLVATAMKWAIMQTDSAYDGHPLIENPDLVHLFSDFRVQTLALVYAVSSAVQELIVRGALQSMLESFLVGPARRVRAILVCALLFSVSHLHTSLTFALMAFVPAVFWGWLFSRRRNLIGVTLSHIIVGAYVFFVMGIHLPR